MDEFTHYQAPNLNSNLESEFFGSKEVIHFMRI